MRRFLIALTLLLLLIVSVCAGIAVANWPHWACSRHLACGWHALQTTRPALPAAA